MISENGRPDASCRRAAMDLLARREYGAAELERRLLNKGFDSGLVRRVLERLQDEGLQDDARFAESFVRSRVQRGQGPVRIRGELARRGVADGMAEAALAAVEVDWPEAARQVRAKKFGAARPVDFAQRARQSRFLYQRGFTMDQIHAAVGTDTD